MMDTMLNQKGVSFKDLEQEIFRIICEIGRELTEEILERYDQCLHDNRDRAVYRDKGKRSSTIKTIYGEVVYDRHVYQTRDEYGQNHCLYLLDEKLKLERIGLVSENCVEFLVSSITEMSYRNSAAKATEMTGLPISHTGVWNIVQKLGEKLEKDEEALVEAHEKGLLNGEKEAPVLFEEADGVWLALQGKDRERRKFPKAEMKAAVAYDGWKDEGSGRTSLDGKVVTAGFEKAKVFQKKREAMIASAYDLDETELRIMNGDGAAWIKKTVDKETVFQLDPFHRNKSIRENIGHPKAVKDVMELLEEEKADEAIEYLKIYRDSLSNEEEIINAEKLIKYFTDNQEGLLPYKKRGISIPESPKGLSYRNMGTMENHIWSVIARRMKHNHTSWSIRGGNHLAKILAKKCSGKLYEVTEKLRIPMFEEEILGEIEGEVLSAGRIREKVGRGYEYPVIGKLVIGSAAVSGDGSFQMFR